MEVLIPEVDRMPPEALPEDADGREGEEEH
jgi:hypothetical protein